LFRGSYVAIVTPFKGDEVDLDALGELIERQLAAGTDGIVPAGCTGEAATLSHEEHHRVIEFTVKVVAGRAKVIAGAGSNCTSEAISLTRYAEKAGADAVLHITPYYNKPTQEGIYRHYKAVAEVTGLPVMLYNVPSRTGREIEIETAARCGEIKNIVAIKEAGGSVDRASRLVRETKLEVLSGDDSLTLPMIAVGAVGVVSVVANLVPRDVKTMVDDALAARNDSARALHLKMLPLVNELFRENNPMGVKAALKLMGLLNGELRMPLCELRPENEKRLAAVMRAYGGLLGA